MSNEYLLRVTLIGDGATGKTSIRNNYMGKGFVDGHLMTVGADFAAKKQKVGNYNLNFQIWDLAGQKAYTNVIARFYMGSLGGICIFDLTRPETFQNINHWIEQLWKNNGKGVIPLVLVGNKVDLKNKRKVKRKDAEAYAIALSEKTRKYGFEVKYFETSAKTGENIEQVFYELGKVIMERNYDGKF